MANSQTREHPLATQCDFLSIEDFLSQRKPTMNKVQLGDAVITVPEHLIDLDANPFIPYDGCKVEEHQKGGQFRWDASKVALYLSKKQRGSSYIDGSKLRDELKGRAIR